MYLQRNTRAAAKNHPNSPAAETGRRAAAGWTGFMRYPVVESSA